MAATTLAVIVCASIAGCGSGGGKSVSAASTTTTSTTTTQQTSTTQQTTSTTKTAEAESKATPSKKTALAYAHAVNLRAADLTGFTQKGAEREAKEGEEKEERQAKEAFDSCSGAPPEEDDVAEVSSPEFTREAKSQTDSVKSEVTVAPSTRTAAAALAVLKRERTGACLSSYFAAALTAKPPADATVGNISATKLAAPANSFGWRLEVSLKSQGATVPLHVDLLGFVQGRAEVSLFVFALPELFPPTTERHVVSLLMERAKSHKL